MSDTKKVYVTMSPYQALKNGLLPRLYIKADVLLINEKINMLETKLKFSFSEPIKKMLDLQMKNREFVIRQINQQMLEK